MALGNYIANIETDIPWLRGWLIATPVEQICTKLNQIVKESKLWDGDIANLQVANAKENTVEIRILVSACNCSTVWDLLRCARNCWSIFSPHSPRPFHITAALNKAHR
jgi:hypothetical protein